MAVERDGKGNSGEDKVFTKGNLRGIVKRMGIYEDIEAGETFNQCLDFSEQVLKEFLDRGIDAIMVQSRDDSGTPIHHYVLAQIGSGNEKHAVIVDPTIGQFYHKYHDVFVGTREEMQEKFVRGSKSQRIFDEYWPEKIHVCEPELVYGDGEHTLPTKVDPAEFQEKWGDHGVIQQERFTARAKPTSRVDVGKPANERTTHVENVTSSPRGGFGSRTPTS